MSERDSQPALARRLNLPLLVLYGLGTIVGAGIYALVGAIAAHAGAHAPFSFLVAAALVGCTALTFAELSSRLPYAAGEAVYIREGLGMPRLGVAIALIVGFAGCVSAATISNAFVGYLGVLAEVPRPVAILGFLSVLVAIAAWGISESVIVASIVTLIELGGLLLIIVTGAFAAGSPAALVSTLAVPGDSAAWLGILSGALLAFYAFIGFEDMVNLAEEVEDARTTLPRALVLVLIAATIFYMSIVIVAVSVVTPAELAASDAPLALVYTRATGRAPTLLGAIGIVSMLNGALVQIIMYSRILYGLANQGSLPAAFGWVNARTRTPIFATAVAGAIIAVLALLLPLTVLARWTSTLMLTCFTVVNAALIALKRRDPHPEGARIYPVWVPMIGFAVSLTFWVYGVVNLVRG